jgi:hypothetical protein
MSLTSKSTLSLKKRDVQQQRQAGTAYRRLVFAHKANAGETGINFTALVQPSEMAALGFVNPNAGDILAANILFYKKNLTIISSARGVLMQDLSYTVPTSSRIEFQGFTALQDEIFTCILETGVRDGLTMVDASPIVATGELAVGATDFNVGTPFEVNKYDAQQIGAVLVFRNGQIQFRNPGNGTTGGNYQEVNNGSGLGTVIRFNTAPSAQSDNIVVWGHLMAERPDGSMMAAIESLAGQIDQMIPTLAAVAGVPETTFQGAPNNQDLKAFGDTVLSQGARITSLEKAPQISVLTSGSGTYVVPTGTRYLRVRVVGGGGGGGGGGGAGFSNGASGGNTTFGSLSANGGAGGTQTASNAVGGVASGGDININGSNGGPRWSVSGFPAMGGMGGANPLGMPGANGELNGGSGTIGGGFGGGGGGGGASSANPNGGGGGAGGGYCEKWISSPAASYAYAVGAGGTGGTGGANGASGGNGAGGVVIIEAYA